MRSLTATLLAAQRSASAAPYLRVEVADRRPEVARPVFERLYAGAEPDSPHAAVMAGDGALLRARIDPATGGVYAQRVASPGPGGAFGSWTLLGTAAAGGGIALAAQGSRALIFYLDPATQRTITARDSADWGATWGPAYAVLTPPSVVADLAAAISPAGVDGLFYASDGQLWVGKRTSGVWGAYGPWPYGALVTALWGHACVHYGDWMLAVCGQASTGESKLWTVTYGDGASLPPGAWSPLREVARASAGSGVEHRAPSLAQADVFRLWHVESYSGASAYSRPVGSHLVPGAELADNRWREGVPFDLETSRGVALAYGSGCLWLSTASGVWRGAVAVPPLSLTDDVLAADLIETRDAGYGRLVLRNDDGRYNSPGSGALSALRLGSQVSVGAGYRTSAGAETPAGPVFWISGWEHVTEGGRSTFHLRLEGGWELLTGWRARSQQTWTAGAATAQAILEALLAKVGMRLVVINASPEFTALAPDFTVHPRDDGATSVRRLLALLPDSLFFRDGAAHIKHLQPGGPVDYEYGEGHPVLAGRYGAASPAFNRAQAYGLGVAAEAFLWDSVAELHDRLLQVHDLNLMTHEAALARAEALLAREARLAACGEITAPVNCGQELFDLVQVSDAQVGLSAARRRVMGLRLRYDAEASRYTHTLTLGGE